MLFCIASCAEKSEQGVSEHRQISQKEFTAEHHVSEMPSSEKETASKISKLPSLSAIDTSNMSPQEILNRAEAFYEKGKTLWEQNKREEALAHFDQAYVLIVQVDETSAPDVLERKNTLRLALSKRIQEINAAMCRTVKGPGCAIPLTLNADVQREIDLILGPNRKWFLESYKRAGRYHDYIANAFRDAGLPEELAWLPLIESGYNTRALSPAHALGLWQFIDSTGRRFGLERNAWVDERMDPEKSTQAAISYLKSLHEMFGDWTTVLAAYNCGEGLVARTIQKQKINYMDNFWDLYRQLPEESARFVPKFLAVLHVINNPERYNIDLSEQHEPLNYETVTLTKQVHLKSIADELGVYYNELLSLNPALRQEVTPNVQYELKVPAGKGAELMAKLDDIPAWTPASLKRRTETQIIQDDFQHLNRDKGTKQIRHRVQKGETFFSIAQKYKVSVLDLLTANNMKVNSSIKTGSILKIPLDVPSSSHDKKTATYASSKASKPDTHVEKIAEDRHDSRNTATVHNSKKPAEAAKKPVESQKQEARQEKKAVPATHTVQAGDTLFSIARRNNLPLERLLELNKLHRDSRIAAGQTLRLN
ncbi:MAG: LysM peptidoglycan-binding domain-containing protein [Dissulfuribacterales bacterium]